MRCFIVIILILVSYRFYTQSIVVKDMFTGAQIEYAPVKTWVDGSLMTDEKIDDIIYIKKNTQYYLRIFSEDKVNVKWFGAKGDNKTDDSRAIQRAVNSGYALYFPPGTYKLNVTIFQHIKMEGNGINTILKPFDISKAIFLYKTKKPFWSYSNVLSNMILESDLKNGFGVAFGNVDLTKKEIEDEYSGNVTFQNISFKNFDKAVYFPFGNIGSNFYNCSFQGNKYGIYSLNNKFDGDIMHAGNKYFYGCEFSSNDIGAYVNNTAVGFGGISFMNVIFQMNQINAYVYSDNTYMPLQFLDCWDEKSATGKEIAIDAFNGKERIIKKIIPFSFYFEGKNSTYNFFGGRINNVKIEGDNINVNAYSSNFEHLQGVEAKDSNVSQNSYLNLINASSEQGIQIHSNINVNGKANFPNNTLVMKPNTAPFRVFSNSNISKKLNGQKMVVYELSANLLHFTGSLPNSDTGEANKKNDPNIKINFTAPKQYMRIEESKIRLFPGYYLVNFDLKVNKGKVLLYIWDRDKNQFISLIPIEDGKYHSYTGIGKLTQESEMYLDISSKDGNPVDLNISNYKILKAKDYQELMDWF